jgi:hypothetical protein
MRGFRRLAAAAAVLLTLSAVPSALAQETLTEGVAPQETSTEATVATTLSTTNRMLVPVTIGGAGPYHFIVDTAAERSVVARDLAQQLGLAPAGRARLLSMTSTREVEMVSMPEVSFVNGQARTLRAFALNGEHVGGAGFRGRRNAPGSGGSFREFWP